MENNFFFKVQISRTNMQTIIITCSSPLVFPEDYSAQPAVLASKHILKVTYCRHPGKKRNAVCTSMEGRQERLKIINGEGYFC